MLPNDVLGAVQGPADPINETVWQHPSRSVTIRVQEHLGSLLAERALRTFKAEDQSEIGGLLFGRADFNGSDLHVFITEAEFVPSEGSLYNSSPTDQAALIAALARHKERGDSIPVGYFRSDIREGFSLTEQDKRFVERYLPKPTSVSLLIRPFHMGVCMAGIFLWEKDRVQSEFTDFEVPLFVSETSPKHEDKVVKAADPLPVEPVRPPAAAPVPVVAIVPETRAPETRAYEPAKPSRKFPYFITAIAVCLCGLIPGSALYFYERLQTSRPQPVVQGVIQPSIIATSKSELDLRVSRPAAGQLDVVWDRNLPATAKVGLLEIVDGSTRRKLILDQTQLRLGKLTYFSNSADISFRLDVAMQNGPSRTEYVRVLGFQAPTTRTAQSVSRAEQSRSVATPRKLDPVAAAKTGLSIPASNSPGQQTEAAGILPMPAPISQISLPLANSDNQVPLVLPPVPPQGSAHSPEPAVSAPSSAPKSTPPVQSANGGSKASTAFAETDLLQPQPARKVMPDIRQIMPAGVPSIIRVGVIMTVDKKGQVTEAHSTTDVNILTNACIAAVKKWRFTPASVNRRSVESNYSVVFVFRPTIR